MVEGVAGWFVVASEEIYVEDVLPRAAAEGAGFDFAQADVAEGEDAERFEESSRLIFYFERYGRFVGALRDEALVAGNSASLLRPGWRLRRLANQEEAGEVAFVVLDAGLENFAGVFAGGVAASRS